MIFSLSASLQLVITVYVYSTLYFKYQVLFLDCFQVRFIPSHPPLSAGSEWETGHGYIQLEGDGEQSDAESG